MKSVLLNTVSFFRAHLNEAKESLSEWKLTGEYTTVYMAGSTVWLKKNNKLIQNFYRMFFIIGIISIGMSLLGILSGPAATLGAGSLVFFTVTRRVYGSIGFSKHPVVKLVEAKRIRSTSDGPKSTIALYEAIFKFSDGTVSDDYVVISSRVLDNLKHVLKEMKLSGLKLTRSTFDFEYSIKLSIVSPRRRDTVGILKVNDKGVSIKYWPSYRAYKSIFIVFIIAAVIWGLIAAGLFITTQGQSEQIDFSGTLMLIGAVIGFLYMLIAAVLLFTGGAPKYFGRVIGFIPVSSDERVSSYSLYVENRKGDILELVTNDADIPDVIGLP